MSPRQGSPLERLQEHARLREDHPCETCGGTGHVPAKNIWSVKVGPGPRIILCLDCLDKRNAGVVPVG